MRFSSIARRLIMVCATMAFVAGCAETQLLSHAYKRLKTDTGEGHYKVGTPYQIKGVWYYPKVNYSYDETGIASWYGPNFHGKKTANGEIFDQNAVSAAHKTIPLPSIVRVTNLDNGRSVVVRVNDRGPYAKSRIIDMSKRAAELLGFKDQGTARVRVELLADESRKVAAQMRGGTQLAKSDSPIKVDSMPKPPVTAEPLALPEGAVSAPATPTAAPITAASSGSETLATSARVGDVSQTAVSATDVFVQAGAFSSYENANRARALLSDIGPVRVSQVLVNNRDIFRVRVGPIVDLKEADAVLGKMIDAGYAGSRVVIDKSWDKTPK